MFVMYGLWAWKDHSINFTSDGFNHFLEISKLPLIILASSVPLAAIVSNIHRTIQTEAQINSSETKNSIDRHFAHEKNFVDKIKEMTTFTMQNFVDEPAKYHQHSEKEKIKLLTSHEVKITNPYLLYSNIYTKSTISLNSDYSPDEEFKGKLLDILDVIENSLSLTELPSHDDAIGYMNRLNTISFNTAKLLDILCVDCISNTLVKITLNECSIKTFTHNEGIFGETLEGAFYLTKKILKIAYGVQLKDYVNIYNYLYIGDIRFKLDKLEAHLKPFYSPEWSAYVSKHPEIVFKQPETVLEQNEVIGDGDRLATEH
ncbi:hypothetical protein [Lelliottia amnigena]|uniref:hypothetical protein n=1 Tax=Lelliottia amnigena TaxID=61646 RepID=UPI003017DCD6